MVKPHLETPAQINIDKRITNALNTHSIFFDDARPSVLAALEVKRGAHGLILEHSIFCYILVQTDRLYKKRSAKALRFLR